MATAQATSEEKIKVNRREFLNLAWLASLGFLLVDVGGVTLLFAYPRFKEGEFGGVFSLGDASVLPKIEDDPQANPKGKFWLTQDEEGVRAIYKVCTHLGCLYAWQSQENRFICPCHGSQFSKEGEFLQGPAPRSLDQFVVRVVDPATGAVLEETTESGQAVKVPEGQNVIIQVDTGNKLNGKTHG